jgi:hypothetical protein
MFYVYQHSATYIIITKAWERIKTYSRYSFIGQISEIKKERNTDIFTNSHLAIALGHFYKISAEKIKKDLKEGLFNNLWRKFKQNFSTIPIQEISVVLIAIVLMNIVLSFLMLKNSPSPYNWFIRFLLLYLSVSGIFCHAKWEEVKKSSFILSRFFNGKNKDYPNNHST